MIVLEHKPVNINPKLKNQNNENLETKDSNLKDVDCVEINVGNLPENVTVTLKPLFSSDNIEFVGIGVCGDGAISIKPGGELRFTCNEGAFSVVLNPKTIRPGNPTINFKKGCAPSGEVIPIKIPDYSSVVNIHGYDTYEYSVMIMNANQVCFVDPPIKIYY